MEEGNSRYEEPIRPIQLSAILLIREMPVDNGGTLTGTSENANGLAVNDSGTDTGSID